MIIQLLTSNHKFPRFLLKDDLIYFVQHDLSYLKSSI